VADNVATVPRLWGWDKRRIRRRVDELLELVGLAPESFRARFPHQLSGGQRQRVGVARALAADPPVLLMDEPFGAVDRITRDRLQNEFLRIQEEVRKTVVFVTHDIEEAVKLADRIAILRVGGVLEQYDKPSAILAHPASDFVAELLGHDRGLKRLSVTRIDPAMLEKRPVVPLQAPLAEARRAMDADDADWAVVLDGANGLHGELRRARAEGEGTVADRARRLVSRVTMHEPLSGALEEMLLHDAEWVAVFEGDRVRGVLTPQSFLAAVRSSMRAEAAPQDPDDERESP